MEACEKCGVAPVADGHGNLRCPKCQRRFMGFTAYPAFTYVGALPGPFRTRADAEGWAAASAVPAAGERFDVLPAWSDPGK